MIDIHAQPDPTHARSIDAIDLANLAKSRGIAAGCGQNHYESTAS